MSRRLSRLGRAFCPQPRRPSARPPRALHGGVGPPPDQRSLLSSGASRTASLTFARSRRSSGGSAITASWNAASIINMLSSGFSAHSHHRSKASLFVIKKVLLNPLWDRREGHPALGREFNASEVPKLLCTGADEPPLLQRELENA